MKHVGIPVVFAGALCSLLAACGGGGGGTEPPPPAAPDNLTGTYTGSMAASGAQSTLEAVHVTIRSAPPNFTGSIYHVDSQRVFTLSGALSSGPLAFTASSTPTCSLNASGTIDLSSGKPTRLALSGTDCVGAIAASAQLSKTSCVNLAGRYLASETGSVTCIVAGQSETQPISGSVEASVDQDSNCGVSYTPPGGGAATRRTGTISGSTLSLSGALIVPNSSVQVQQNSVTLQGEAIPELSFRLSGSGGATGSTAGQPFSCSGQSSATFKRCFDVAVPILRGGPYTAGNSLTEPQNVALHAIRDNINKDSRVIARVFDAGPALSPRQILDVQNWLSSLNVGCRKSPIPALIIGHSLGADGALRVIHPNVCTRVFLDFWDSDLRNSSFAYIFNQRSQPAKSVPQYGRIVHYQAQSPDNSVLALLGRTLAPTSNVTQEFVPSTDHQTIAVWYGNLPSKYLAEVSRCIN